VFLNKNFGIITAATPQKESLSFFKSLCALHVSVALFNRQSEKAPKMNFGDYQILGTRILYLETFDLINQNLSL